MAIGGIPPGGAGGGNAPPTLADALAGLKTGDLVTARVQQAVANSARLAIGRAVIDVLTQVALKPGSTVTLQVQRSDSGVTLQLVQPETGQAQQASPQAARPLPASTATQQPQAPQNAQGTPQPLQPQPPPTTTAQTAARGGPPVTTGQQSATTQVVQANTPAQASPANPPQTPANAPAPAPSRPGAQIQTPQPTTGQQPAAQPGTPAQGGTPTQTGTPVQSGTPSQAGTPTTSNPTPGAPASAGTGTPASTPVQVTVVASPQAGQPGRTVAAPPPGTAAAPPASTGSGNAQSPPAQTTVQARPQTGAPPSGDATSSATSPNAARPAVRQIAQPQPVQQVQAVATARVQAASVQTGLAPLFANLEAVLNQPGRPRLEPSVETAARQLLGLKLPSEALADPARLQGALRAIGPYLEAALARGLAPPQGDLKGALLALQNVLKNVLGDAAGKLPATSGQSHPPPDQGSNPQAQRPAAPSLPHGADASEIMRQLAADTEGALARVRLLQIASLPDADGVPRQDGGPENQPRVWQMELPLGTGRETSVMAIRIERDRRARKDGRDGPVWRVRLALELDDAGAISAAIAYSPPQVSVSLWAEQPETSRVLKDNAGLLDDALRAAELDVEGIDVQTGRAPDTRRPRGNPPVGGLLDREG